MPEPGASARNPNSTPHFLLKEVRRSSLSSSAFDRLLTFFCGPAGGGVGRKDRVPSGKNVMTKRPPRDKKPAAPAKPAPNRGLARQVEIGHFLAAGQTVIGAEIAAD